MNKKQLKKKIELEDILDRISNLKKLFTYHDRIENPRYNHLYMKADQIIYMYF